MNHDREIAYGAATEHYNKELDRLFQRFNFFLIGSSFLIAAFVTLLKGALHLGSLSFVFFYLINFAGFLLAVFFTTINLRMSLILGWMLQYLYLLENGKIRTVQKFPYLATQDIKETVIKFGKEFVGSYDKEAAKCKCCNRIKWPNEFAFILCKVFTHPLTSQYNYQGRKRVLVAEHTWFVPYWFIHFWWVAALLSTLCRCGIIHP